MWIYGLIQHKNIRNYMLAYRPLILSGLFARLPNNSSLMTSKACPCCTAFFRYKIIILWHKGIPHVEGTSYLQRCRYSFFPFISSLLENLLDQCKKEVNLLMQRSLDSDHEPSITIQSEEKIRQELCDTVEKKLSSATGVCLYVIIWLFCSLANRPLNISGLYASM